MRYILALILLAIGLPATAQTGLPPAPYADKQLADPAKEAAARDLMEELGIGKLSHQLPTQLSGGQQQKVGIARALISNPWILMADEPTGNLDSTSSDDIIALFDLLNRKHKRTIIMVTHNPAYWEMGTRRIEMKDGLIVKESHHG